MPSLLHTLNFSVNSQRSPGQHRVAGWLGKINKPVPEFPKAWRSALFLRVTEIRDREEDRRLITVQIWDGVWVGPVADRQLRTCTWDGTEIFNKLVWIAILIAMTCLVKHTAKSRLWSRPNFLTGKISYLQFPDPSKRLYCHYGSGPDSSGPLWNLSSHVSPLFLGLTV